MTEIISVVYIHIVSFNHSSVDGHLGGFYNFIDINSAAIDIGEQVSPGTNFEALGKYSGVV